MAVTPHEFNKTPLHLLNGDVAFVTDTVKLLLVDGYTFDATHDTLADVKASVGYAEADGSTSDYPAGGVTLAGKTITAAGAVTTLDAGDVTVTTDAGGSITATGAILHKASGVDGTSFVLAYFDFGAQTASDTGVLKVTTGSGLITITASV